MDKDKVVCLFCGKTFYSLEAHLMYIHHILPKDYKIKFPGAKVRASSVITRQRETLQKNYGVDHNSKIPEVKKVHAEKVKLFWKSSEGTIRKQERVAKWKKTMFELYGETLSNTVGRVRSDEEKKKQQDTVFEKYGVYNVAQVPEIKKRIIATTRKSQNRRPTDLEKQVAVFLPSYVKYTGDYTFWVDFKNGKRKNPDFVVRPFRKWRKVIEVNSEYHHTFEEAEQVIQRYAEAGIRCLTIWMDDLFHLEELKKKISNFLALPPQRPQIEHSEKSDGMV